MIHVCVPGNQEDVNGIPFARLEFFFCHGQKFCKIHKNHLKFVLDLETCDTLEISAFRERGGHGVVGAL